MVMDNSPTHYACDFANLAELVEHQALQIPEKTAFVFEGDAGETEAWTYETLAERSRTLGAWLAKRVPVGDRVLLVYPPGLEFIGAFLGCIYAGVLPVPATYPKPRRPLPRLDSIATDCTPSLVLTHSSVLAGLCLEQQSPAISALAWEATDQIPTIVTTQLQPVERSLDDIAFLQYTSGSTSEPRGVMVTHGNILHNLGAISAGFGITPERAECRLLVARLSRHGPHWWDLDAPVCRRHEHAHRTCHVSASAPTLAGVDVGQSGNDQWCSELWL